MRHETLPLRPRTPALLSLALLCLLVTKPATGGLHGELRARQYVPGAGPPSAIEPWGLPSGMVQLVPDPIPFTQGQPIELPSWPSDLEAADFDRDGHHDVAAAIPDSDRVVVWCPATNAFLSVLPVAAPLRLASGRFVRSPAPDLVVLSGGTPGMVTLFQGRGDGRFKQLASLAVGSDPTDMEAADLDGDRRLDLVISSRGDSSLYVVHGSGRGFGTLVRIPGVPDPWAVSIADENGDGRPDLQVALHSDSAVRLLTNGGDGTWAAARDVRCHVGPHEVRLADLDGDGTPDLLAAGENALEFRTGPQFASGVVVPRSVRVGAIECSDLDGTGASEVLVGHGEVGDDLAWVSILSFPPGGIVERARYFMGQGVQGALSMNVQALAIADLDGDGGRDVLAGRTGRGVRTWLLALRQLGGVALAGLQDYELPEGSPVVDAVDFELRGRDDLLVSKGARTWLVRFTDDGVVESTSEVAGGLHDAVLDLDADGRADLIKVRGDSVIVTRVGDDGSFEPSQIVHEGPLLSFGDFDGDGDPDLVARAFDGRLRTCWNDGGGQFGNCSSDDDTTPQWMRDVDAGDIDGDGVADLAFTILTGSDSVLLYRGLRTGGFEPAGALHLEPPGGWGYPRPDHVLLRDLDGDLRADILVLLGGFSDPGVVWVRLSRPGWTFEPRPSAVMWSEESWLFPLDVDSDGDLDIASTMHSGNGIGRLQYLLNDGDGTLTNPRASDFGLYPLNLHPRDLAFGRFGADAAPDLAVGYHRMGYGLMLNTTRANAAALELKMARHEDDGPGRSAFGLEPLVPNPGLMAPIVHFRLAAGEAASLSLFDLAGRRVRQLAIPPGAGGRATADLSAGSVLAPGLYWVRLAQGRRSAVARLVVLR